MTARKIASWIVFVLAFSLLGLSGWKYPCSAPWIGAALLGGLVGATELLGRYRDEPLLCVLSPPGFFYIVVNMCASLSAYKLFLVFGWTLNVSSPKDPAAQKIAGEWAIVLAAGLSSMAFFRSSLFVKKVGDQDVGIGPGTVLTTLLEKTDVYVDRVRAVRRVIDVDRIMKGLDYTKATGALPPLLLKLLQTPSAQMQLDLKTAINLIQVQAVSDAVKLRLLGLELMNLAGVDALEKAVLSLGSAII